MNVPEVTVYSKPLCVQCDATKRELTKRAVPHKVVDVTEDAAALERVKELGYRQAPVVTVTDKAQGQTVHWGGFRPDKIKALSATGQGVQNQSAARRPGIAL